ncbi:unnamed protein product [Cylindrotheca closterium]|uniref:Protein-L-isoaspartate(D-aspartate) O-methyltransferase n=1 Tax=Cylindrotheca closterium TaxID=2856 RepID=A0AAD2JM46_9STRA|nr:unnamed protein product [Cylindrotheca closterium]
MAWRSSGSTNDEMVNNLKRFGLISSIAVENAFRNVDRSLFVPESDKQRAYSDQPLKDGNVHLSAPHIYCSVLEALELEADTSGSFLNAGSGSGYLTCLAASIMGPRSSYYCVEIHEDVIQHSTRAMECWKERHQSAMAISDIEIIHGNALEIDAEEGEAVLGFDRIYIGAAIETEDLHKFQKLLKPGGILVGPVEDELLKVVRNHTSGHNIDNEFSQYVISGVRFAPLIAYPSIETVIAARVWNPSIHNQFPDSFRSSCKELLLCSNADFEQPITPQPTRQLNVASMLPKAIWMEVMSYTHRDWFKTPESEVEVLRRQLKEERENAEKANRARLEAEARYHTAQRERDVYQLLARRWKSRLHVQLGEDVNDNLEDAAISMLFGASDNVSIFRLLRRVQDQMEDTDSEEEEDESEDDRDQSEAEDGVAMDEDGASSSTGSLIASEPAPVQLVSPSRRQKMLGESERTVTTVSSSSISEDDI